MRIAGHDAMLLAGATDESGWSEALEAAQEKVTEDEIAAVLDADQVQAAHEALAAASWVIGELLGFQPVRDALAKHWNGAKLLAHLDTLSREADRASDERNAAIEKCARAALEGGE